MNNEVSDLNNKLYEKNLLNKNEIQSDIFERKSRIDNLKINKDSLITNLQILIVYIEKKEKEKYNITQMINDLTKEVWLSLKRKMKSSETETLWKT